MSNKSNVKRVVLTLAVRVDDFVGSNVLSIDLDVPSTSKGCMTKSDAMTATQYELDHAIQKFACSAAKDLTSRALKTLMEEEEDVKE